MKIYGIILSVLGAASVALSTSCHGELDVTQSDKLNTTNMWTSESDALTATTGIYYRLRQAFAQSKANPFFWGELRVGPAMWGKGTGRSLCDNDMLDVMLNTLSASDASTDWSYLYTTIDQCNQVLKYAPGIGMSEDNMNYCLGNARFIRAYCYFWIARVWGDAPVITTPTEGTGEAIYPSRHPVAEVYARIEDDLNASRDDMSKLLDMVFSPDDTVLIGGDQPATFSTEGEDMLGEALPPRSYHRNLEELDELLGNGALGFGLTSRKDEEESNEAQANGEE